MFVSIFIKFDISFDTKLIKALAVKIIKAKTLYNGIYITLYFFWFENQPQLIMFVIWGIINKTIFYKNIKEV